MIGIKTEFECGLCGDLVESKQILVQSGRTIKFNLPHACKCGNKGRFTLLSFAPLQVELYGEHETVLTVPNEVKKEVSTFANDKIKTFLLQKENTK